jgi:dTMP kinase
MEKYPGKLIVIDGTDGSGKTTQLKLLKESLEKKGYLVKEADFPQYNTKSAGLVEEYLSGKYGKADDVTPYQSSIFYAVDRFDASFKIKKWLKEGNIVLSNRYVSSSLGHQGGKIADPLERKVFFNWLYELEYKIFDLPQPDLSLILFVDPEISQKLSQERKRQDWEGKTKDIHEDNLDHLSKAAKIFIEISQSFPNFKLIKCTKEGNILKREAIHNLVYASCYDLLKTIKIKNNNFQSIADILESNGNIKKINSNNKLKNEFNNLLELKLELIDEKAKLPRKAHEDDAGFDLFSTQNYSIPPYGQTLIATGVKIALPKNHVALIWDKSGLASQGYTTMGGVIDSNYRGEIKVVFKNLSEDIVHITEGQKVAQLLIQKIENLPLKVEKIIDDTGRQDKAFGSSGKF